MKPIPYSLANLRPWDYAHLQQISTLTVAVKELLEELKSVLPSTNERVTKVAADLDRGFAAAHELAAVSALLDRRGENPLVAIQGDEPFLANLTQFLHQKSLLPVFQRYPAPFALAPALFYGLEARQVWTGDEGAAQAALEMPALPNLAGWYARIVAESYRSGKLQYVEKASIFGDTNATEPALLMSLSSSSALVLLLSSPRFLFLHLYGHGADSQLIVSSRYSDVKLDPNPAAFATWKEDFYTHFVQGLANPLQGILEGLGDSEFASVSISCIRDFLGRTSELDAISEVTSTGMPVTIFQYPPDGADNTEVADIAWLAGANQTTREQVETPCTIRRGTHPQLGPYTSLATARGEIIFRDGNAESAYAAYSQDGRTELVEAPLSSLAPITLAMVRSALSQAFKKAIVPVSAMPAPAESPASV